LFERERERGGAGERKEGEKKGEVRRRTSRGEPFGRSKAAAWGGRRGGDCSERTFSPLSLLS
jgi:hypothetical protein